LSTPSRTVASPRPASDEDVRDIARLLTEGGDERIAVASATGRNAYGCGVGPWAGGSTFSSTTATPLTQDGFDAARRMLARLTEGERRNEVFAAAAEDVRARLAVLCGLGPAVDIVLAPSGTDLHRVAAALARTAGPGGLVTVMPDPAESGRGVERAVRGLSYATRPPFAQVDQAAEAPTPGQLFAVALREPGEAPRPVAEVDAEVEAACARAMRAEGGVLLVLLDVSKTGLAAPSAACAAALKARYGARLTVLVDACQFRLGPGAVRAHLDDDFLVAVTGSKFLAGPAFSGALLVPGPSAERLRQAALAWRTLECSAREDFPDGWAGRALLPAAFSLGPALRWAPALEALEALAALPRAEVGALVAGFGAAMPALVERRPDRFEALATSDHAAAGGTIFPLLLKRDGAPLTPEAVAAVHLHLRDLALARSAGHLWIGQPVTLGAAQGQPLSAVRLALSAPQLTAFAGQADGCDRLVAQADECLWEIARLIDAL
jgi:hypothetical protein